MCGSLCPRSFAAKAENRSSARSLFFREAVTETLRKVSKALVAAGQRQ